jgi:hypothetical protein
MAVSGNIFEPRPKRKRPGTHAKSKSSLLVSSKLYRKKNKGQGK